MKSSEIFRRSWRLVTATSSHVVLLLISVSIALLSYFTRSSDAIGLVPVLATIAGMTVVEYGKRTYKQFFHLMLLSGAQPKHFSRLKLAISLTAALVLSLSTAPSGRVSVLLATFVSSWLLSLALLSYYVRKVKEGVGQW